MKPKKEISTTVFIKFVAVDIGRGDHSNNIGISQEEEQAFKVTSGCSGTGHRNRRGCPQGEEKASKVPEEATHVRSRRRGHYKVGNHT
jgi:hypothetical protein